jgi:hypothetical protein
MRIRIRRRRSVVAALCAVVMGCTSLLSATGAQAGTYAIIANLRSNTCLDDTNGSVNHGNQMQIWDCNGLPNQGWELYKGGWCAGIPISLCTFNKPGSLVAQVIMLKNQKSGLCLNMMGGANANNGSAVAQWPCNSNDPNQLWDLYATSIPGYYIYANYGTAPLLCMTVSADSTKNGAKVQGWNTGSCPLNENDSSYFWTADPLGTPPS